MMNMKRSVMIALAAAALLAGGGTYAYMEYSRGTARADEMPVAQRLSAAELLQAFQNDEQTATKTYVGATEQVVQVSGSIRSMEPVGTDKTNVVLETGDQLAAVVCEFDNKDLPIDWRSGAQVNVKGICTGLLMDVVLVRCVAAQ